MKFFYLKKLYLYIFIIPFLISLCFYYYSVNNKKFQIEYIFSINKEIIHINRLLKKNSQTNILSTFGDFVEKYKYSSKIKNIELLINEKKLILKQWRLKDINTPFAKIKFSTFGVNYDESIFDKYISDLLSMSIESLSSQLDFEKSLLTDDELDIASLISDYNNKFQETLTGKYILPPDKFISMQLTAKNINLLEKAKDIITSKENYFIEIESQNLIIKPNMDYVKLSIILYFIISILILFILKFYSILSKNILSIKKKNRKIKFNKI